jgi:hypothetical protein
VGYRADRYLDPRTSWVATAWNVTMVWLWDEAVYDWEHDRFDAERLLATYDEFGGLDAVVLWHAYPVIGVDPRNQFDWYREVPGLQQLVGDLHTRGVRVFIDYNPWDTGTRRAGRSDAEELATLVTELGVDGVFLDTLREGDPELLQALNNLAPPPALEGESRVPLARIRDHQASWAQWFADSAAPGVLRARWFEQRHMMHHTRRWNRQHHDELVSAWVNGAGVLIWDVVFGVWVGWSDTDRACLRAMRRVHTHLGDLRVEGDWEPLTDLAPQATAAGIAGSRWERDGIELFNLAHSGERPYSGPVLAGGEARVWDAFSGRRLDARASCDVAPGALLGLVRLPIEAATPDELRRLLSAAHDAESPAGPPRAVAPAAHRPQERLPALPARGQALPNAVHVRAGNHRVTVRWRQRETGLYEEAPYVDDWKPLPPRLHQERSAECAVSTAGAHVDPHEVTNADFENFVRATGYRPENPHRFLAHWPDGKPPSGAEDDPVTYVDLDDARAYASWRGARLPTEHEWQLAAAHDDWRRLEPLVWSWTESEHRDGRTRWVILKGGSWYQAAGSEWYVDGGRRGPEWSLRLLLTGAGTGRSPCIGFRCAVDDDSSVVGGSE